ncbi:MAG TPA: cytochrome P450 [Pseudonocardia sp.]|uniref:cytochrome P450 family protein n=1 Tax=Pseudonocardia sp. TaxID=60912 RepID=UPI002ED8B219
MSTASTPTTTGDLPDMMAPELVADPYREYGRLREQGPVLRASFMGAGLTWMVTRYDEVHTVLGDPRFVNNPASVPGMRVPNPVEKVMESYGLSEQDAHYMVQNILSADPPDHSRLRKLVSRAFTVRRVGELRPRVQAITGNLLDELAAGPDPVDLTDRFCYPLPITVICELVGIPEADRPDWREWGRSLVSMDPRRMGPALHEMVENVKALIDTRRSAPSDDLVSALIRAHDEDGDRLSDEELVTFVVTLVMAGHETTAHLIGNSIAALLAHPDQLAPLREHPELWPTAVHELVRWCGTALLTGLRYAAQDVRLGDVLIKAGESVSPVLVAANYDPRQYTDPDRLDVTRQPTGRGEGHVGFGHGAHYCLGAALARQEAEVALHALFDRFPRLALAVPESELVWQPVPGSRRLERLPVTLR